MNSICCHPATVLQNQGGPKDVGSITTGLDTTRTLEVPAMPNAASNTTNPCCHHAQIVNTAEVSSAAQSVIAEFTVKAIEHALCDQQYMAAHVLESWLDRVPYERRNGLVVAAYYAGLVSHETAKEFVPGIDEERC